MKRAKIKKTKKEGKMITWDEFKEEIARAVMNANYVCMATTVRTLKSEFGFGEKRLKQFSESYMVLVQECADHRSGPRQAVKEAQELTGIDVKKWVDEAFQRFDLV